jgi:hypothetical protein
MMGIRISQYGRYATCWTAEEWWFDSRQGQDVFLSRKRPYQLWGPSILSKGYWWLCPPKVIRPVHDLMLTLGIHGHIIFILSYALVACTGTHLVYSSRIHSNINSHQWQCTINCMCSFSSFSIYLSIFLCVVLGAGIAEPVF